MNVDELLGPLWLQIVALVFIAAFLYQMYFWSRYMTSILRREKKIHKGKIEMNSDTPPVSVIICARDEAKNIRKFLHQVLEQDYPEFEVIVVNDSSSDETDIILDEYKQNYPHLRKTFVPDGTRNLSTKKLALTLGIKAASYEWLVFTDADCYPASNQWLREMAKSFGSDTELVLGYGAYREEKGILNRLITFDTLFLAMQYLGFTIAGKPYMGVGRNMAYKKELFYKFKGFASHMHLKSGDDDLMINKAATNKNTSIVSSTEGITWSVPKKAYKYWLRQKERHLSVSVYYKSKSKSKLIREPFMRFFLYIGLIALLGFAAWPAKLAAFLLYLTRFLMNMRIINRTSVHFGGRKYYADILLFDIWLPLVNLYLMMTGRMGKKSKYIDWK